jgi:hypothetical protein
MTNDMSFNNKVSGHHASKCKPDCLKQIFEQGSDLEGIQTTRIGQSCARHCMRCDCPGHNRTKALVTLYLSEIVEIMGLDQSQHCSIEMVAAAFWMSAEQIARFSNGGSEEEQPLGPCNCTWLKSGFTGFDPYSIRVDNYERAEVSACSKGYPLHNSEIQFAATTIVERANLAANLSTFLSRDQLSQQKLNNTAKMNLLELEQVKNQHMVLRVRMTWPNTRFKGDHLLSPVVLHSFVTYQQNLYNPVLHLRLAVIRHLVHLLQTLALRINKGPEFEQRMKGLFKIHMQEGCLSFPKFMGNRATQIATALSDGVVWDMEQDSFSLLEGKTWMLQGLFEPKVEQKLMACFFFC